MIEARVDLRFVERVLNTLRRPDLRPAWKEARKPLREDIRDHARKRQGPSGSWSPRAAVTRERAGHNGRARRELGRLASAQTTLSDRRRVAMRSRIAWSDVHRTGGAVGHGAKLPARDVWWASDKVLGTIAGIVSAFLAHTFAKGG